MTNNRVRYVRPLQDFLRTEAASGLILLAMVIVALVWANGPFASSYEDLWSTEIAVGVGSHMLDLDLRHWINEGLMALFFFIAGLEIKRELIDGNLRDPRQAMLPVFAALGGMVVPAAIYMGINAGGDGFNGWGIPMATDIAIVLAVLAIVGDRVPPTLKTFLLTLAIVDDIGAVLVIAFVYSDHGIDWALLTLAAASFFAYWLINRLNVRSTVLGLLLAGAAWFAMYEGGLHATLAGVVLGLLTPARPVENPEYVDAEALADVSDVDAAQETVTLARDSVSTVEWLQHVLHPWSSYLVLPLFALANAGVVVSGDMLNDAATSSVAVGVVVALVIGKPVGILLLTWLVATVSRSPLPVDVQYRHIAAAGVLAGIGFTVSLFVADLAFTDSELIDQAKIGVMAASVVAGVLGWCALRWTLRKPANVR